MFKLLTPGSALWYENAQGIVDELFLLTWLQHDISDNCQVGDLFVTAAIGAYPIYSVPTIARPRLLFSGMAIYSTLCNG